MRCVKIRTFWKGRVCVCWMLFLLLFGLTGCKGTKTSTRPRRRPADPLVIAAVGDSITWGALAFGAKADSGGYPAILESRLRNAGYNIVVFNKGIPGEKAYQTHERFARAVADVEIVLLMIGVNDIIRPEGCPEPHHCHTAQHIAAMVDEARTAGVAVLLSTVTPAQARCDRNWANAPIEALNVQIVEIARKRKIPLADNHQAILASDKATLFSDCLHFTDDGYHVLAEQWYQTLLQLHLLPKISP